MLGFVLEIRFIHSSGFFPFLSLIICHVAQGIQLKGEVNLTEIRDPRKHLISGIWNEDDL